MSEKSGEKGKLYHLDIERKKRVFDDLLKRTEELIDKEKKGIQRMEDFRDSNKLGLLEDLQRVRKKIIKFLSNGEIDPEKAREMLNEINEAERGIKNRE